MRPPAADDHVSQARRAERAPRLGPTGSPAGSNDADPPEPVAARDERMTEQSAIVGIAQADLKVAKVVHQCRSQAGVPFVEGESAALVLSSRLQVLPMPLGREPVDHPGWSSYGL